MSTAELKNLLFITLGSCLLACGVSFFLLPAKIATGGTPGMAILAHFMTGLPTGQAMLMINLPLLMVGFKFIGLGFALRSVYSILLSAIMVDFFSAKFNFPKIDSLLLITLYGGFIIGIGVGLILRGQASVGGTTIIAKLISRRWPIKPAQVILTLDLIILISIGFIFADMEKALWSLLSIYATTQVIDKILSGSVSEKIVHIVSKKTTQIGKLISQQLDRDGTILSGNNLTGTENKDILFVVVDARQLPELKKILLEQDPLALMIIMQATEHSRAES